MKGGGQDEIDRSSNRLSTSKIGDPIDISPDTDSSSSMSSSATSDGGAVSVFQLGPSRVGVEGLSFIVDKLALRARGKVGGVDGSDA